MILAIMLTLCFQERLQTIDPGEMPHLVDLSDPDDVSRDASAYVVDLTSLDWLMEFNDLAPDVEQQIQIVLFDATDNLNRILLIETINLKPTTSPVVVGFFKELGVYRRVKIAQVENLKIGVLVDGAFYSEESALEFSMRSKYLQTDPTEKMDPPKHDLATLPSRGIGGTPTSRDWQPSCILPSHSNLCNGYCENSCKAIACPRVIACGSNWVCKALAIIDFNTCILACDFDNDSVANGSDNCPCQGNSDQSDCNSNGVGDVCDPGEPARIAEDWVITDFEVQTYCFDYSEVCHWVPLFQNCNYYPACPKVNIGYTQYWRQREIWDVRLDCDGNVIPGSEVFVTLELDTFKANPYYLGCCYLSKH